MIVDFAQLYNKMIQGAKPMRLEDEDEILRELKGYAGGVTDVYANSRGDVIVCTAKEWYSINASVRGKAAEQYLDFAKWLAKYR